MSLSTGIIGLPNVGKSTLFNAITNSNVEAANYPFATIDPNIGIVYIPDKRLEKLAEIFNPEKVVYESFKFVDIAGLVKGASKGEGLGNKFLQNIREVDSICHVIRCFDNLDINHVENSVDPIRDLEIINLELIISDLEIVMKRFLRIKKSALSGDKVAFEEYSLLERVIKQLENSEFVSNLSLNENELFFLKSFNLITLKPFIFIANVDDESLTNLDSNQNYLNLKKYANERNIEIIPISAKLEFEISEFSDEEKKNFLSEYNIEYSGLENIIISSFKMLNLSTFFTCGKKEIRAWQFQNGSTAPQTAGIIHTDFERGFIKAAVISYEDMIEYKDENKIKSLGKLRLEGKKYIVQDGDICDFRFNV